MSLFLGKIHHWLYHKILWSEKVEREIIRWAKTKGLPVEGWVEQNSLEYGQPIGEKALEEVIDTSNIHGWLQDRIQSTELRQASLITNILAENENYKEELIAIFNSQGKIAAEEYLQHPNTPEEVYNAVNDFILEGMPCDRASQIISNNENEIIWEISNLHEPVWAQVKGNIENFYDLRDAWISSFIEGIDPDFSYNKMKDRQYRISRA